MIRTNRIGEIVEIIIDNPEHGNAVTDDMAVDLIRALEVASATATLAILRGEGSDFCAGRMSMGKRPTAKPEALDRRRQTKVIFDCYDAFRRIPVPIVGVVRGRAHGFGCAIAALCDVTLAADTATFSVPEMSHNIFPTMVMSALTDRVSRKVLSYLVYSVDELTANEALQFGLISKVFPEASLSKGVSDLTMTMLSAPKPALRGVKEYVGAAYDMSMSGAVQYAENLHATINSSSEMRRYKEDVKNSGVAPQ